jgi:hypothetical protein
MALHFGRLFIAFKKEDRNRYREIKNAKMAPTVEETRATGNAERPKRTPPATHSGGRGIKRRAPATKNAARKARPGVVACWIGRKLVRPSVTKTSAKGGGPPTNEEQ